MKGFSIKGKDILLANVGGKYYATGQKCTHMGGDLAKSTLEGTVVTCPRHGSRFDVTNGNRLAGPAKNNLPSYPVKIEEQVIKIAL